MAKPFGSTSIAVRETESEPFYRQLFARSGFGYAALDADDVSQAAMDRYGADAMNEGYRITTTLDSKAQEAATLAIRNALLAYDRRHGWRGAEASVDLPQNATPEQWQEELAAYRAIAGLEPGLVTEVDANGATGGSGQ